MFRKLLLGAALLGGLIASAPSYAVPVTLQLGLAIDGSGSISASDFALQANAYSNELAALLPLDGSVAIEVVQFASTNQLEFALAPITAANIGSLQAALTGMVQLGSNTAIGNAIALLTTDIIGSGLGGTGVIDVSTDGQNNTGVDPTTASLAAVAAGISRVNCVGIGGAADCSFIAGTNAFSLNAANFTDFADALRQKLTREVIPEPTSLVVLATGLIGAGLVLRRRKAA
jgi:hypothetical protein